MVSATTYQERLLKAGLPEGDAFKAELLSRAAASTMRGYILFLNGIPISYLYLPIEGQRAIYASLGYDPSASELSPGIVLQLLALEDLCNNTSISTFDFTQGRGQHKEMYGTFTVSCMDILFVHPTIRNRLLVSCHKGWMTFETNAGRMLDVLQIKKLVKKWIRNH